MRVKLSVNIATGERACLTSLFDERVHGSARGVTSDKGSRQHRVLEFTGSEKEESPFKSLSSLNSIFPEQQMIPVKNSSVENGRHGLSFLSFYWENI